MSTSICVSPKSRSKNSIVVDRAQSQCGLTAT